MKNNKIFRIILTDHRGREKVLYQPLFGTLNCVEEPGKIVITRVNWWGRKRIIIPSQEDRVEIVIR